MSIQPINTVTHLPIIDISPLLQPNDTNNTVLQNDINRVSAELGAACTQFGFFYIKNHGIHEQLLNNLEQTSALFFSLPQHIKDKILMSKGGRAWRGYFPVGNELTSGKPDLKEGIYYGKQLTSDHESFKQGKPLHGENLFLDEQYVPEMKQTILTYLDAIEHVSQCVMDGIALSLSLPRDYFRSTLTADPLCLFRIFHYPDPSTLDLTEKSQLSQSEWGVGEHTDYGLLTLLYQDNNGGLQVYTDQYQWIEAPPIPNTFICNIGDMLERLTNSSYLSTPHRVRNISGRSRYSFPFFFDPGFDCHIKALPIDLTKHHEENAAKRTRRRWDNANVFEFEGTYGQYLLNKVSKVFPQLAETQEIQKE